MTRLLSQLFGNRRILSLFHLGLFLLLLSALLPTLALAGGVENAAETTSHAGYTSTFLWIAIILLLAKMASLVERLGLPSVLGELLLGVLLGNLILLNIPLFEGIKHDTIIPFLAELGVVILLFQIGLESNIEKMKKVGVRALLVALVGVILPFILGTFLVGPFLLPGLSTNTYLFIGATLTATSVGITARVFQDLKKLQTPEAQIVLGAAVIDDVLGLIILAVVSQIVVTGNVSLLSIAIISGKALAFLIGAIVLGRLSAPLLGKFLSKIHTGIGMKFTLAISFGLFLAYCAGLLGLAPIVGAFAAGLVLDPVHFRYFKDPHVVHDIRSAVSESHPELNQKFKELMEPHAHRHVEDLIEPLGHFLVPIFFVVTGMAVKLETLADPTILLIALGLTLAAFIGKIAAGLVAGKVNRWLVGWGMVPRGEVGLIFAAIGKGLGVINDQVFSVIVVLVMLTTLIPPPVLAYLLKKSSPQLTVEPK